MTNPTTKTVYDDRYKSKSQYWDFKPSSMAIKILELLPPVNKSFKVLEIGCGEGGTSVFLARNGYEVTAFDLAETGVHKTLQNAEKCHTSLKAFVADINEFLPDENYDVIFSSGTLQYLLPDKRKKFIEACQKNTNPQGLNIFHTFVSKPFIERAPDAESNEYLWSSGELLLFYKNWRVENFIEEIKICHSSGVEHQHAHNRIWARKIER